MIIHDSREALRSAFVAKLLTLPRRTKLLTIVGYDYFCVFLALYLAFVLRLSDFWPASIINANIILFAVIPPISVALLYRAGFYRVVIRFLHVSNFKIVMINLLFIVLVIYFLGWIYAGPSEIPFSRTVPIIFAALFLIFALGGRLVIRGIYLASNKPNLRASQAKPVIICGAGQAGVNLVNRLSGGSEYIPICFIDDDSEKWNKIIYGFTVLPFEQLDRLLESFEVYAIIIAIPSLTPAKRNQLLKRLEPYQVAIKVLPFGEEFLDDFSKNAIRDVSIEDMLGRDTVAPDSDLLAMSIRSKNVFVTGAGGSIGSVLAKQAVMSGASTLVLYEQSEFALYTVERKLSALVAESGLETKVVAILGSILDRKRVRTVLHEYRINTAYHAAAYKHVPLVEHNAVQGLNNNVIGTVTVAEECDRAEIERFVLVSTDKAVRPTNVMGATKRLAELFVQGLAHSETKTTFSIVRFGNVLGSSGSVVPLFKEQIRAGGPVTVTHPNVTRYFMTIPEAASLVVQAGALAKGGEVFVLDMGEPILIFDLATKLIHLSGFSVKSETESTGDIEIQFTGLRPGEKLYEELLIGDDVSGTEHPKIMQAAEERLDSAELERIKLEAIAAIEAGDSVACRRLLRDSVVGYSPSAVELDVLPQHVGESAPPRV